MEHRHAFGFGALVTIALSCPSVMESNPSCDEEFPPSCSPIEYEGGAANIMPLMLTDVVLEIDRVNDCKHCLNRFEGL